MPQFFIDEKDITGGYASITGEDYRHLVHVRRIKQGTALNLSDYSGTSYCGIVSGIEQSSVKIRITDSYKRSGTGPDIVLYLCLLKGGNFEYAVRKSVEVGVNRIIPLISERTVPDPDKKLEQKTERWSRIASEACKQCMRTGTVQVGLPLFFEDAVGSDNSGVKITGHPGAAVQFKEFMSGKDKPDSVSIMIGPEGGFTEGELAMAVESGWSILNFGMTHLRAETAAAVIPALVIYEWGIEK